MGLSCSRDYDYEGEYGDWQYSYENASYFEPLKTTRRKRCCSCNKLIDTGGLCANYPRYRYPYSEVEARIVGADPDLNEEPPIKISDHYQCEQCAEIWLNLTDIGYEDLAPNEDMAKSLKEYHEISGFKPETIKEFPK